MQNPTMLHELNKIHIAELRRSAEQNNVTKANNKARATILSRLSTVIKRSESEVNRNDVLTTQELRTINVIR